MPIISDLISTATLAKCKKGVRVVNVARGGIVDEAALFDALQSGHCGGAAIDVYPEEPPKSETSKKLINHAKVVATPHLGMQEMILVMLMVAPLLGLGWVFFCSKCIFFWFPINRSKYVRGSGASSCGSGRAVYSTDGEIDCLHPVWGRC